MLLTTETMQAYSDVLVKAQAYQVCASLFEPVDFRAIHAELVVLYKFRASNDEVEVQKCIDKINDMLDRKIETCNRDVRSKIVDFIVERQQSTWMYGKLETLTNTVNLILHTTERIEDHVDPRFKPVKKSEVTAQPKISAPPVVLNDVKEKLVKSTKKSGEKKHICGKCGKEKLESEFYTGRYHECKKCRNKRDAENNERQWMEDHGVEYAFVIEAVEDMDIGHIFTVEQLADITGVSGKNNSVIRSCVQRCIAAGLIEVESKKSRINTYKRVNKQ